MLVSFVCGFLCVFFFSPCVVKGREHTLQTRPGQPIGCSDLQGAGCSSLDINFRLKCTGIRE